LPIANKSRVVVSFADYEFGGDKILSRDGVRLRLKYQSAQLLALLLDHAGEVVTRDEIREALWDSETFVDFDQGINNCIREIRSVLHDQPENPRYIETVAKLGYRFLAPIHRHPILATKLEAHSDTVAPIAPIPFPSTSSTRESSTPLHSTRRFINRANILLVSTVLVVLGAAVWALLRWSHPVHAARSGEATIVVLPFMTSTTETSAQYLSEGITESLIDDLSRLGASDLNVIARTSSNAFIGLDKPANEIGHELNADYILRGRIEPLADRFKLTAELLRTKDSEPLWTYEGEWTTNNIMGADPEIARGVMRKLALKVSPDVEKSLAHISRMNPRAYNSYLLGRHDLSERSRESLLRATQEFKGAIEDDPDSGPAYAGLADADNLLAFYGGSPFYKSVLEAEEQAAHAIQIDDSLAEAHAALGYSEFMWGWQWTQADTEFRKALALNPNYSAAHHWYALYLAAMGRFPEARKEIAKAEQLDPLSAIVYAGSGYVDYLGRDYNGAIQQARLALALNPKLMPAFAVLGDSYSADHDFARAAAAYRTADQIAGGSVVYGAQLARVYALSGQPDAAKKLLSKIDRNSNDSMASLLRAEVLEPLGSHEEALALLYKGYERNDPSAVWLKVDPQYDSFRSDPKFQELLQRMKFPN
jgi:TolB-like protein/DNA-binding winged helix-turn-helix (wHTH) protein/Flp pilus assembly protein TadD